MRMLLIISFVTLLIGCTTSNVLPVGDNKYIVISSGAGFDTSGVIEKVYKSANSFCAKQSKSVESLDLKTRQGQAASNPPNAELVFRCINNSTD